MSIPKGKLSDDLTETETMRSVISHKDEASKATYEDDGLRWHPEEGQKRSADIDRYLQAESEKLKMQVKAIVLGMIEPKDTFWKQTALLGNPLTVRHREGMIPAIQKSVSGLARDIVYTLLEGEWSNSSGSAEKTMVSSLRGMLEYEDLGFAQRLDALFRDDSCPKQLLIDIERAARTQYEGRYPMFLYCPCNKSTTFSDLLSRVLSSDYQPTDHDYIHFDSRRMYSCVRETHLNRKHDLRILDLQPTSGERKKWIHVFEQPSCVIFLADLGVYGRLRYDDEANDELCESIMLFESIARSRWFLSAPMLFVLSNAAAFKEKLKIHPLNVLFEEYKGNTEDEAVGFIFNQYMKASVRVKPTLGHVCDGLSSSDAENIIKRVEELQQLQAEEVFKR